MKHIITIITLLLFVVPAFAQDGKPVTNPIKTDTGFELSGWFYNVESPRELGRLYLKDGRWHFEGNADESARAFLKTLNKYQNAFRLTEPQLLEYPNLGFASGMAQSPAGYPVMLSDVVPNSSIVSIWGKQLSKSAVTHILLLNQGREWALKAEVYPQLWFGLETCVFRLPSEIHGEVIIKAIGESRNSNKVRILVE